MCRARGVSCASLSLSERDVNEPADRLGQSSVAGMNQGATAYGQVDAAFSAGNVRAAFRLYNRLLFCGKTSELDPEGWDTGALTQLDAALHQAGAGDLRGARKRLG